MNRYIERVPEFLAVHYDGRNYDEVAKFFEERRVHFLYNSLDKCFFVDSFYTTEVPFDPDTQVVANTWVVIQPGVLPRLFLSNADFWERFTRKPE